MNGGSALESTVSSLGAKISAAIINPLIQIGFLIALVYFLFGVMKFILQGNSSEKRTPGNQHMLWGTIGLTIMFTANALMYFIGNTGDKLLNGKGQSVEDIDKVVGQLEIR
jgi:drug/metabolite transporter (DMT)-like permease